MIETYPNYYDQTPVVGLEAIVEYHGVSAAVVWTKIIIQGVEAISGEPVVIVGKYRLP